MTNPSSPISDSKKSETNLQSSASLCGLAAGVVSALAIAVPLASSGMVAVGYLSLALGSGIGVAFLVWGVVRKVSSQMEEPYQRRHYFDGVVQRAVEGICVCHEKESFPYVEFSVWNERMAEITGYTMEEINELGWYQALYPDEEYREKAIARMGRMRDGDDIISEEWVIRRKNGHQCVLNISTSLSIDESGVGHVLGVMNDVTEVRGTRDAMEILAKDLSTVSGDELFEEALDYLLRTLGMDLGFVGLLTEERSSVASRVVRTRKGGAENFVYDLEHTPCQDVFDESKCLYFNDVQSAFPEDELLIEMNINAYIGIPLYGKDGKPRAILVMLGHEKLATPESAESIASLFSARLSLEVDRLSSMAELSRAKEKAEESDRLKSAFLANMSHEIRTPLNGIMGFAQLMQNSDLSKEDQEKYLDIIDANGKHLLKLIGDLIEIAQIEAKQITIDREFFDLSKMMEDLYADFKNQIQINRGDSVVLICDVSSQLSHQFLEGDEVRLKQVLYNLLNNAMKFTHEGQIEFGMREKAKGVLEFWVRDSGIGIDEREHERIFGRFHQTEQALTRNYDGSGLGLAICKGLVELMGGDISVESQIGNGSRFTFHVEGALANGVAPLEGSNNVEEATQSRSTKEFVVLAAEDNDSNYMLLEEVLKRYHIELLRARDGLSAVEIVELREDIDLILMDVRMPGIDGYEASRRIAKIRPNIPIIIQTAFASKEDEERATSMKGRKYLSKPIDPRDLMSLVDEFIEKKD